MGSTITHCVKPPTIEMMLPRENSGYVIFSTPTEGYSISQGLETFEPGNRLGLLCLTTLKLIHQSNSLARLEVPLKDIFNVQSRVYQMNYMTYPDTNVVSLKCTIDNNVLCINFKVDNPEDTCENIERARTHCIAVANKHLKRQGSVKAYRR